MTSAERVAVEEVLVLRVSDGDDPEGECAVAAGLFEADRGIGEQRKTNRIVRETPDPEPIIESMLADLDPEDAEWVRRWSPGGRRSHAA